MQTRVTEAIAGPRRVAPGTEHDRREPTTGPG